MLSGKKSLGQGNFHYCWLDYIPISIRQRTTELRSSGIPNRDLSVSSLDVCIIGACVIKISGNTERKKKERAKKRIALIDICSLRHWEQVGRLR